MGVLAGETHGLATLDVLINVRAHDMFFWNTLSSLITLKCSHCGCHCLCSGMGRGTRVVPED